MKTTEHNLQKSCVKWFRMQYPEYALNLQAIPNGAKRDARTGKWYKDEGMTAGAPDLILLYPSFITGSNNDIIGIDLFGVGIEFKTEKGRQTDAQKQVELAILSAGYGYWIVRDFDDFKNKIENYMM